MKNIVALLWIVAIVACASPSQVLINPKTNEKVNCSTWGFGYVGTPIALVNFYSCVNKFEAMGYIPIEEYDKQEVHPHPVVIPSPELSCMKPSWTPNTKWTFSTPTGEREIQVKQRGIFRGIPVYSVSDGQGKELMINENLGLCAILNQGVIEGEYTPPLTNYDWPLVVGKKWESRAIMSTPTGKLSVETSYEVQSYQKIAVPAGVFDCFYIVGQNDTGLIKNFRLWYSPEVQYHVKSIKYSQDAYVLEELLDFKVGTDGE